MASEIVAVSLEFRLESARSRSSRLYSESLRESRLLSSPISDRSRGLVSVQMKSDTTIIFARFPHFRVPIVSHRGAIYYNYDSASLDIISTSSLPAISTTSRRGSCASIGEFERSPFHFFILLRVNLTLWHEAMAISLGCITIGNRE